MIHPVRSLPLPGSCNSSVLSPLPPVDSSVLPQLVCAVTLYVPPTFPCRPLFRPVYYFAPTTLPYSLNSFAPSNLPFPQFVGTANPSVASSFPQSLNSSAPAGLLCPRLNHHHNLSEPSTRPFRVVVDGVILDAASSSAFARSSEKQFSLASRQAANSKSSYYGSQCCARPAVSTADTVFSLDTAIRKPPYSSTFIYSPCRIRFTRIAPCPA